MCGGEIKIESRHNSVAASAFLLPVLQPFSFKARPHIVACPVLGGTCMRSGEREGVLGNLVHFPGGAVNVNKQYPMALAGFDRVTGFPGMEQVFKQYGCPTLLK